MSVIFDLSSDVDQANTFSTSLTVIPMLNIINRDELKQLLRFLDFYKWLTTFRITCKSSTMADNVQRALQNLDLGINDVPVALPIEVVNQAVAENRFIIIGVR